MSLGQSNCRSEERGEALPSRRSFGPRGSLGMTGCERRKAAARFCVAVVATACFLFASRADADSISKFFKPPKASNLQLDPAGIYPTGQQFPIGFYSVGGNSIAEPPLTNMARVAQNGFTYVGPYYSNNWSDFSQIYAAANENMKFVFSIRPPASVAGLSVDARPAALASLSDAALTASVHDQVAAVLSDPIARDTVSRWSLGTEELRYWIAPELHYLKVANDAIIATEKQFNVAPKPFTMYEPGQRDAAALKKTGKYQDMVSKGTYLTDIARGPDRSGYEIWSYSQIISAANSEKSVPQAVLELSQDFADPTTNNSAAEIRRVIRNDAYLGLVMGIKSIDIWSMTEIRPNLTTFDQQFQAYASVAQDLTGDLDLQKAFLFGDNRSDLKFQITTGAKQFQYVDSDGDKFKYDTLYTLNTELGSDRYLFLVNSTEQPMSVNVSGLPAAYTMENLFSQTTTDMHQTSMAVQLDALGVTALRFRAINGPTGASGLGLFIDYAPEPTSVTLLMLAGWCGIAIRIKRQCRPARDA